MDFTKKRLMKKQLTKAVWAVLCLACLLTMVTLLDRSPFVEAESGDFAGGEGTEENPYLIETAEQLNHVRNDLDKHYKLNANINLAGYENWEPIGDSASPFRGTFDGNGYKITNLKIYRPGYIGLFGSTEQIATIMNVILENVDITGQKYVGALAGYNRGTIKGVLVNGTGEPMWRVVGREDVGGMIGYNDGQIEDALTDVKVEGAIRVGGLVGNNGQNATIIDAGATGDVTGRVSHVGGLVGYNEKDGRIENAFAKGSVTGNTDGIGGLVGINYGSGSIENSFATGNVWSASIYVGGLVGTMIGNISNTYATGEVTGKDRVGGLVGFIAGSEEYKLSNSFALNSKITATAPGMPDIPFIGRIAGNDYTEKLHNNHALEKMSVTPPQGRAASHYGQNPTLVTVLTSGS